MGWEKEAGRLGVSGARGPQTARGLVADPWSSRKPSRCGDISRVFPEALLDSSGKN